MERAGKTPDKKGGRGFRDSAADGKEIYFHDTGGYRQPGASCQLQKTGIIHERLAEYHLQNDAGRMQQFIFISSGSMIIKNLIKNLQNIFTLSEKTTFRTEPRLMPKQQWNGCCHPE